MRYFKAPLTSARSSTNMFMSSPSTLPSSMVAGSLQILFENMAFILGVLYSLCMSSVCQVSFAIRLVFPTIRDSAWGVVHVLCAAGFDAFSRDLCAFITVETSGTAPFLYLNSGSGWDRSRALEQRQVRVQITGVPV